MQWPLALIKNIYPGSENIVRSVEVKTSTGVLKRSIQGLHNLEASYFERNDYCRNAARESCTQTTSENYTDDSRSDEDLLPDPSDPEDCAEPDPEVLPEDVPATSAPVVAPDDVTTVENVIMPEPEQDQRASSCTTTRAGRKVRPRKILDL